jgi:uncharacterized membrane protein
MSVAGNVLDVAILVDGLAVFIGGQIVLQIYWPAAKNAGHLWKGAAIHKGLLRRAKEKGSLLAS